MKLGKILDSWKPFSRAWRQVRHDSNPESVHDLRVVSRHITASLTLAHTVSGDDRLLDLKRRLKKVRKKLGRLRDVQVQRARVQKERAPRLPRAFERSLRRMEEKEARKVRKYLAGDRKKEIHLQLKRAAGLTVLDPQTARQELKKCVDSARSEFREARSTVVPENPASVHALRLRVKKLRYLSESASAIFGIECEETEGLTALQASLGEIRDSQVFEEQITTWLKKRKLADKQQIHAFARRLARQRAQRLKQALRS